MVTVKRLKCKRYLTVNNNLCVYGLTIISNPLSRDKLYSNCKEPLYTYNRELVLWDSSLDFVID
jgi:hypothetical protein